VHAYNSQFSFPPRERNDSHSPGRRGVLACRIPQTSQAGVGSVGLSQEEIGRRTQASLQPRDLRKRNVERFECSLWG
jgi:hypothetical protein